jgi:uroporphyrinogen decarboxylase
MNSRERVMLALNHKEPDRIPVDLGGGVSSLMKNAYINLLAFLNMKSGDIKYSLFNTVFDIDEEILVKFGVDFRRVWLGEPVKNKISEDENGIITDIFQIKRKIIGEYMEIIGPPLANADFNAVREYQFPDPEDSGWLDGVKEKLLPLKLSSEYAIVLGMGMDGIFESGTYLFGFEDFLIKLYTEKKLVNYFFDKLLDFLKSFWVKILSETGSDFDILELGDDMANQRQVFFSREIYKEMIKPRHLELFGTMKKYTDAKIFLHCCGSISELIDDLIEVGVDILNPIQPGAHNMEASLLKRKFGERICFHGGIDEQYYLSRASIPELVQEIERVITNLAPNGGYILAPAHNIQSDTSPEKIIKLYETAVELGKYPVDKTS